MGLLTDAKEMLTAATILAKSGEHEVMHPTYYLLGHAIEVALKSALIAQGDSLGRVKNKIGHDLYKAARRVIARAPDPISTLVADYLPHVALLNTYYQVKAFEYRVTGAARYPAQDDLLSFLGKAIPTIEPHALKVYPGR